MMREEGDNSSPPSSLSRSRLFVCAHARADAHLDLAGGKDGLVDVPSVGRLSLLFVRADNGNGGEKAGSGRTGVLCFE